MKSDKVTLDALQYSITSTLWQGEIIATYNSNQLLMSINLQNAELTENQHIWFLQHMPRDLAALQRYVDANKTLTLTQIETEVTFEDFWNKYDEKTRSSKKKAQLRWNRLSKHDQVRAYRFIDKYFQNMPSWQSKKLAESYLSSELWNN
ncbi:MAG: hypothetical protein ACOXZ9_03720 [Bacteroidales bacterium]|jgi:hypothetical protein